MKSRYLALLIALFVASFAGVALPTTKPTIQYDPKTQLFTVVFAPGAVFACTQFQNQDVKEPDGTQYTIHDCGFVDEALTTYQDDWVSEPKNQRWKVYAEIGYPRLEENGVTYVDYLMSNSVEVVR